MNLLKQKPIRIQKIRDSARGEDCTINLPGCSPGPDNETVVLAHYGEPGEKGTALKPDDTSSAYACGYCHDVLDGRIKTEMSKDECDWYWFRGMRRTWRRLIEKGILK